MGAFFVVAGHPLVGEIPHFVERGEEVRFENLPPVGAVESFDIAVLHRPARLDEVKPYSPVFTPGPEFGGSEFGTVVHPDLLWKRSAFGKLSEEANDSRRRQRRIDLDGQGLTRALVEEVECPEAPPAVEAVLHEIHRPLPVGDGWSRQSLLDAGGDTFPGAARQIEPHRLVDSPEPLVIDRTSLETEPVVALPKSPAAAPGNAKHFVDRLDDRGIGRGTVERLAIPIRATPVHGTARASDG